MEFDYFSENYREFEKAFHKLWIGEIPLTYLTDDLLKSMKPHRPYFQMPPQQSVDSKRKWFLFEVDGEKYKFVGVFNSSPLIKKGQIGLNQSIFNLAICYNICYTIYKDK